MRRSAKMQDARSATLRLLLLTCCVCVAAGYLVKSPLDSDATPRITVLHSGLQGSRSFRPSAVNYNAMLLEADSEDLYVSARGAVFHLNASDISSPARTIEWEASPEQKSQCVLTGKDKTECFNHIRFLQRFNSTHLYMCGTCAFSPLCAYIDEKKFVMSSLPENGRDRCPYSPTAGYTGLIVDQQIFTASQYDYRGIPDIRRNSPPPSLKTEEAPTRWLNDADFVGSALVRESSGSGTGDDDKIYFFFTERSQEQTATYSRRVARVARVCKGDLGGKFTLQKRWTSFLKAGLMCSLPESDFHFTVLRSVFVMPGHTPQDTLFYGIFGLEWKNVKASAVCRFSLSDVQDAFRGPYMESKDSDSEWTEYTGKIPDPRPGTCIDDALRARGIQSSHSLPDDVLEFVRRHPLMSKKVQPFDRRPLLFRRTTHYTHVAVHAIQGLDGQTNRVLYMGTDEGWLHKAAEVDGQLHIIEELQLFEEAQPVTTLLISAKQMSVYVGSPSAVVQLPLADCHRYTSCHDCIFARDPHCAWDGVQCVDMMTRSDRSSLVQDVQRGNRGCENVQEDVDQRSRSVRVGDDVLLQCELSSNLAKPLWTLDGGELHGYGLSSGFRTGTDGLLIIEARQDQSGLYTCHAVENDVRVPMVTYNVHINPNLPEPAPPGSAEDPSGVLTPSLPPDEPPHPELLSRRNMDTIYLSLITILGAICVVLTVVLIYVGFCLWGRNGGKYSIRAAAATYSNSRRPSRDSSHVELETISSHCNGIRNGNSKQRNGNLQDGSFLQIVPGQGHPSSSREPPPPAPPLPPPADHPSPGCDCPNGLSATLPSVLRRMNGNSYVLLRQSDSENTSPTCYPFSEELNKILEKRKHNTTQLQPRPDESSV